jgi:hypothetical protein
MGWHNGGPDGALFFGRLGTDVLLCYPTPKGRLQKAWPAAFHAGQWYHVVLVRDTQSVTVYVNGAAVASAPPTIPNLPTTTCPLTLGNENSRRAAFRGDIQLARLYDKAISARQLQGLYRCSGIETMRDKASQNRIDTEKRAAVSEGTLASAGKWLVIFRSSDPKIWNTNTRIDKDHFAMPLAKVPNDIKFLRLRTSRTNAVIIKIQKDQLGTQCDIEKYGWNGTNRFAWQANQLGIYNKRWGSNQKGTINTFAWGGAGFQGWGFGVRAYIDDKQGYTWAGEEIPSTVFEIAVKSDDLAGREQECLLK